MLIDDTYNSNPVSAECAVKSFAGMNYKRKLVIFADMLELGMLSEMYHEKIGRIIADSGIDFLFTIGKFSDSVIKSAVLKGMNPSKIKKFKTLEEITDCLKNKSDSIDAVLIKGSRGMNMDKVADNFKNYLLNKK